MGLFYSTYKWRNSGGGNGLSVEVITNEISWSIFTKVTCGATYVFLGVVLLISAGCRFIVFTSFDLIQNYPRGEQLCLHIKINYLHPWAAPSNCNPVTLSFVLLELILYFEITRKVKYLKHNKYYEGVKLTCFDSHSKPDELFFRPRQRHRKNPTL